jgi:hypothetical protein
MASMKPRHAAALALVGWYLMTAPPHSEKSRCGKYTDPCAPLSQWYFYNELSTWTPMDRLHALKFDFEERCEAKKRDRYTKLVETRHPPPYWTEGAINATTEFASHAQCIASDNPRLKPN